MYKILKITNKFSYHHVTAFCNRVLNFTQYAVGVSTIKMSCNLSVLVFRVLFIEEFSFWLSAVAFIIKTVLPNEEYFVTASGKFNIVSWLFLRFCLNWRLLFRLKTDCDPLFFDSNYVINKIWDITHPLVIIVSYDSVFIYEVILVAHSTSERVIFGYT